MNPRSANTRLSRHSRSQRCEVDELLRGSLGNNDACDKSSRTARAATFSGDGKLEKAERRGVMSSLRAAEPKVAGSARREVVLWSFRHDVLRPFANSHLRFVFSLLIVAHLLPENHSSLLDINQTASDRIRTILHNQSCETAILQTHKPQQTPPK